MADNKNEQQEQRKIAEIRKERLDNLRAAGEDPFLITKYDKTHSANEIRENFDKLEGQTVSVAGRVVQKRVMGKMSFLNIIDNNGRIQIVAKRDEIDPVEPYEKYKKIKKLDIFDIVGFKGVVFRTEAGEISVRAQEMTLLAKSILPPPGKALEEHGRMQDDDLKYRQRYVDLIMDPDVKKTFFARSQIVRDIRNFMDARGYIEVETPILNTQAGGAAARPFITHHNTLDMDMYLRIATELHLKRLIVGGFERVYEMGRIFRNEGMDTKHNPEFTTIELYEAYTDFEGMMDLCEDLFVYCCESLYGKGNTEIEYQGEKIQLKKPWARMTMNDAVKKYTGADFLSASTDAEAAEIAKGINMEVEEGATRGALLAQAFDEFVEDKLIQPTFIYDYPIEISPLAKKKPTDPTMTERFELFCTGRELANAFSELNDPEDQKARFEDQLKMREAGDEEAHVMDEDYINALSYGMPPTGGMGIGIDRMVMLLTNQSSIRDVLLFPTMKPINE